MPNQDCADVIIVGGGPAGMVGGLLLARAGVSVIVLEKHADFFRDFRGDTVHPSTMEALADIGLLDRFLKRPHSRIDNATLRIAGQNYVIGDLSHLDSPTPFIAMMPQWEFLDFLRIEAQAFPSFVLRMEAPVADLIEQDGRVAGVRLADGSTVMARRLVIMADGRGSLVRQRSLLPLTQIGAPMDVLWFRLNKADDGGERLRGSVDTGRMVVLIDRDTYWQAAFLIPKGSADLVKARGIDWLRSQVQAAFPDIDFAGGGPSDADDLFLLSVALDRLERWHRPGLLAIGDAAHAMSPIGGIGINLAVQDAIAMANILGPALASSDARGVGHVDALLHRVQRRRLLPTRIVQSGQKLVQDRVIGRVLEGAPLSKAPWQIRLLDAWPLLRRIPGKLIGHGIRRERVNLPQR